MRRIPSARRRVAVLRHHLRGVECLGERQLLVRIADAVAPALHELLHEDGALRVHHALFGNDDLRAVREASVPVGDDAGARALSYVRSFTCTGWRSGG